MKKSFGTALCCMAIFSITGCQSVGEITRLKKKDTFLLWRSLSTEAQTLFLAHYPHVAPDDRERLLDIPWDKDPYNAIASLKLKKKLIQKDSSGRFQYAGNQDNHTLKEIVIEPATARPHPGPIVAKDGGRLPLRAWLVWEDGRRVDITKARELRWSVEPSLAEITEFGDLQYDCLHSDVKVTANFLNEISATRLIQIRKEMSEIQISNSQEMIFPNENGFMRLNLTAKCTDGTQTDVTCHGLWGSDDSKIHVSGCGQVLIKEKMIGKVMISAKYGNKKNWVMIHVEDRAMLRNRNQ